MKSKIFFLILIILSGLFAGEKRIYLSAQEDLLEIEAQDGFDRISYRGGITAGKPGLPGLPVVPITVVLPQGAEDVKIKGVTVDWQRLGGLYLPHPYQTPRPLGEKEDVQLDRSVYSSPLFPVQPVRLTGVGNKAGFRIADLLFYPVSYSGKDQTLTLARSVRITISYQATGRMNISSSYQRDLMSEQLKKVVINPADVEICAPPISAGGHSQFLQSGDYKEVLITSADLVSSLKPLNDWRTRQGIPCTTVIAADIESQYPGYDGAEKLRNFIIDANADWGSIYFVMVGDVNTIPYRYLFTADSSMPCDHYFADLDGDWDANGNHIYGEYPDDSIDLYSDVYVGRFSVETQAECNTVVSKILTYEQDPPAGYLKKALLPAVLLWGSYWGDYVNDSIATCTPSGWQDIKLYQSQGNLTRQEVIDEINTGVGFVHYAAHGNENGTYWPSGIDTVLHSDDVINLTNDNKLGVHNAIACISGGFDLGDVAGDCFAEHLLHYPGGGVAAIMNTRVGLGYAHEMGPSEYLSLEFYRNAFRQDEFRIGIAHYLGKDVYVPVAQSLWEWAFCIAELNLFGDPVMPMWLDEPKPLSVDHPDSIPLGSQQYVVTATDNSSPVSDALVCIMSKKGEIYQYDYTNNSGQVTFQINPSIPDTLWVTVTAMNFLPYQGFAVIGTPQVHEEQPNLKYSFYLAPIAPSILRNRTTISYGLDRDGQVAITLIAADGAVVGTLVDGWKERGHHHFSWDGRINGKRLTNGVYFIRLSSQTDDYLRKVVIVR